MKQYKLVNKATGEETVCFKVIVKGFDYYVSDGKYKEGDILCCSLNGLIQKATVLHLAEQKGSGNLWGKVIATDNPNVDLSQVIDEVEELPDSVVVMAQQYALEACRENMGCLTKVKLAVEYGYKKSQETHPNSDPDMIEFAINSLRFSTISKLQRNGKELLEIWKDKQIKTIQRK